MNNRENAIELLKNMLPEEVSYANLIGASSCYGDKYVYEDPEPYALELAISALEKQIPKKPVRDREYTLCPNCKKVEIDWLDKYCHGCGQAIDWSVEKCLN